MPQLAWPEPAGQQLHCSSCKQPVPSQCPECRAHGRGRQVELNFNSRKAGAGQPRLWSSSILIPSSVASSSLKQESDLEDESLLNKKSGWVPLRRWRVQERSAKRMLQLNALKHVKARVHPSLSTRTLVRVRKEVRADLEYTVCER